MRSSRYALFFALLFIGAILFGAAGQFASAQSASTQAQPVVSQKQDIAVFALGYYGWLIPSQALGTIDLKIQEVFAKIGRFNVFGTTQRLSSNGVQEFIDTLRRSKEANFVLPEQYQFGEAFLTKAEFERLTGAFVVVVPVVTNFKVNWDSTSNAWVCNITTGITFIDAAHDAKVISIESIDTSGSDKKNPNDAVKAAIDAIPAELEYRIRSIPEFQISTRILEVSGSTVKIQLGSNMGLKKGDEYAIVEIRNVGGIQDTQETGLIMITDVSSQISTGRILYKSGSVGQNTQLKEIAKYGSDLDLYFHMSGKEMLPGLRATIARGFFPFRPYVGIQMPIDLAFNFFSVTAIPVNVAIGGEYMIPLGRLHVAPYVGAGITYLYITEAITGYTNTNYLSHYGFQAGARIGYLINRNMRVFLDAGYDYWASLDSGLFPNYGGLTIGAGVTFKL
ncbi:MAG TPA: hypothetical protein PK105_07800 [Rectinema sp.]|jgi:hypothetical protein|nr:hypothetical protein [Rectinema sp.]HOI98630.1 hypothetical protein [Rectinema sp.]HOU61656.1 hypothetical protein [Rectinema sp.]HQG15632.1 hypothetical protein [Rectinema sp.]